MNRIKTYLHGHALQLFAVTLVIALSMAGFIDPATAAGIGIVLDTGPTDLKSLNEAMQKAFKAMEENIKKVQDTAEKAREEVRQEGTLHTKTNEKLTELGEVGNKLSTDFKELRDRITDVEQKAANRPEGGPAQAKSIGQIVAESDAYKSAKGARNMAPVEVGSFYKTAIVNATLNNDQPLVQADRRPIVMPCAASSFVTSSRKAAPAPTWSSSPPRTSSPTTPARSTTHPPAARKASPSLSPASPSPSTAPPSSPWRTSSPPRARSSPMPPCCKATSMAGCATGWPSKRKKSCSPATAPAAR